MPRRQRVVEYDSECVQGKDSIVVCAYMTVGEQREARQFIEGGGDAFELGVKVLKEHIVEWNWVDDYGEPLPQVPDDPDVIELLTDDEVSFLTTCIQGSDTDAKN